LLLLLLQLFAQTTDDTLVAIDQSTRQSARRKTDEIQISRGGGSSSLSSRAAEITLKLFVTGQGLFLLLRSHSQQLAIEILVIIFTARNWSTF
jgi:hypothetical protein